jgi:lipoprotein-anchoring transpeptidase ErfK/SrfK
MQLPYTAKSKSLSSANTFVTSTLFTVLALNLLSLSTALGAPAPATTPAAPKAAAAPPPPPAPPTTHAPAAPPAPGAAPPAPATVTPAGPAQSTQAKPAAKAVRHGAIDGSFTDGKLVLGKTIPVNGFHKGLPTLVLVDMGSHTTFVLQKQANDRVVKVYSASDSVGSDKTPTPPGPYWVAVKLKFPCWLPPKDIDPKQKTVQPYNKDHKNPLGVARIGLNKWGINLHGTNQPGKIRQSISHGCIRHSNNDIMKIYDMVTIGTPVIIADQFVGTTFEKTSFDLHGKHTHKK